MSVDLDLLQRLGVAVAIGAVVGVERHWREREAAEGQRTAGLRTYSLAGLLGGCAGLLEKQLGGVNGLALGLMFLGFSTVFAQFNLREAAAERNFSVTSTVAAMATFALGAVAVVGDMRIAAAGGVAMTALLASREYLHALMRAVTWAELRSVVLILAMTFLALPLIPDQPAGPFGGISPARVWMLAILLAAISFAGHVAVKALGPRRGEVLAGALAGLTSSTASVVANGRKAAAGGAADLLAAGSLAASAVAAARSLALVAAFAPAITERLGPALVAAGAVFAAGSLLLARNGRSQPAGDAAGRTPFDFLAVVQMALLLAAIAFAARAAAHYLGAGGVIVVSALSGLADVDAAIVTAAGMIGSPLTPGIAALAMGAAVAANTVAKAVYATLLGGGRFALAFAGVSAAALAAGLLAFAASTP